MAKARKTKPRERLFEWRATLIKGTPARYLGHVRAPDGYRRSGEGIPSAGKPARPNCGHARRLVKAPSSERAGGGPPARSPSPRPLPLHSGRGETEDAGAKHICRAAGVRAIASIVLLWRAYFFLFGV